MTEKWEARKSIDPTNTSVIFQTLDWYCDDLENPETGFAEYSIFTFGISDSGEPINLKINNFYPFFFVELPDHYDATCVYSLKESFGTMVKSIEFVKKKRYYGFENNKIRKFVKLTFWNYRCYRSMSKRIETEGKYELYESNIDPILCFTHIRDILTAGWVSVKNMTFNENGYFECSWTSVSNYPSYTTKPCDTRIMYFDIEACSEDGSFPNALKKNDKVTQICCINKDTVTKKVSKYLFNLGTIGEIEDTIVIQFKTEKDLLISFNKFVVDTNPDIIVGYNIFGFDNGFMFERAKVLGIEDIFNFQSKIPEFRTEIVKKVLNNQQSGFNEWKMTKIIGRTHIDLLQVIKKDFKLESYKLDYVGEHFLEQGKDDVTPKEIFEAWDKTNGSREKRTRIGKYCVQDTNLCLLLFEKFAVLPNHIEMAKVTRVPLEYLITRGQSIKVFSQIAYETRKTGYLIPTMKVEEATEKFQGATVLKAKIGHYTKPVCGLDFASLYPSIMIAHNMCYSTIVLDPKYLNIPGVEYSTIAWTDSEKKEFSFSFVQSQDGVLSGILQSLWKNRKITKKEMNTTKDPFEKVVLNAKQLAIKVSMNSIYGFTGATVGALPCLGISQSVTGCGRQMIEQTQRHAQEMFCCEIIYGDSVTGDTPVLIRENDKINTLQIKDLFERNEPKEYPQFKAGESGLSEKEQSIPTFNIEIWTSSGWSPLKRTIRHRCEKNIYRILTHTGLVDVTEDHSLLDLNLNQIKPSDVQVGSELFHSYPINYEGGIILNDITTLFNNLNNVPDEYRLTFIQGFFVGDGSSGKYNCPSGIKYSWALNNADIYILETFQEWLSSIYEPISFKILDTIKSSGVYKLVPQGDIKYMVNEFDKFYSNRIKIVTTEILNSSIENQKWFFYGYYLADGYKCYNDITKNIKLTAKNKLSASQYYLLGRNLGFEVSINDRSDKLNVFTLTFSQKLRKSEKSIKKIRNLGLINDYVYDLETEDGTFQAGIGQMIVKNTDSCYVIFPEPVDPDGTLTTLFKVAQNAAKKISETFKKPIELEFEKFMYPLILVAKKRYLYLEWTEPEKHNGEIEAKGVELVRRDNCPYVKETLEAVLHPIMFNNNPQEGRNQAEIHIDRLLEGNVPVKSLILSKNLKNDYKGYQKDFPIKSIKKVDLYKSTFNQYPLMYGKDQIVNKEGKSKFFFIRDDTAQKVWFRTKEITVKKEKTGIFELTQECPTMAHVALVEKMISRDPNGAPKPGDRVPFVYVDIGDPKALSWKKTEDPVYVVENNIPIDSLYYLDHQVRSPLETIFDIIIGPEECKKMFERKSLLDAKKREKISIGDAKRKNEKNKDIRSFFKLS